MISCHRSAKPKRASAWGNSCVCSCAEIACCDFAGPKRNQKSATHPQGTSALWPTSNNISIMFPNKNAYFCLFGFVKHHVCILEYMLEESSTATTSIRLGLILSLEVCEILPSAQANIQARSVCAQLPVAVITLCAVGQLMYSGGNLQSD